MPFLGLGLHIFVAIFFAIHVVRSGQNLYWLIILFSFPLLGSVVYFFAIYLPDSRLQRGAMQAVAVAAKALDPQRELRNAEAAFAESPTAQNQMRLAAAQLEMGRSAEAARSYEACLVGPFATDVDIKFGAARAFHECQRYSDALSHLEAIRESDPRFRAEAVAILLAKSYAGVGRPEEARAEFESAVARFGTFEVRAEYAMWALTVKDFATASRLRSEIDQITRRWNAHTRELNANVYRRLQAAVELLAERS